MTTVLRAAFVAALLSLAGCGTGASKAQVIADWMLAHCGVAVSVASVSATMVSGSPFAGATVETVGNALCKAFQDQGGMMSLYKSDNCPVVNGVCIEGVVVDRKKLDEFKPK